MKPKIHYTAKYLLDPGHPVTVNLVGCGGTGSHVLYYLAAIHCALIQLEHPGLYIRAFDPDQVDLPNIGRQQFTFADIGINKAVVLITRMNRYLGTGWDAYPVAYTGEEPANIIITCVDTVKARFEIGNALLTNRNSGHDDKKMFYWLDFGNSRFSGQVFMGMWEL